MLNGKFRGKDIGSGTDVWKFSEAVRAGEMTPGRVPRRRSRHEPQPRRLQDHGHGLDHGSSLIEALGFACQATAPCRRSIPGARAWRT